MKSPDVKKIMVVSNTHWDREFRFSFEKTRHNLLRMMDITLDILESDPTYHSFTMDGHSIMIDDYLEMRPERTEQVKKMVPETVLICIMAPSMEEVKKRIKERGAENNEQIISRFKVA